MAADPYPDLIPLPPFSPLTLTNRTLLPHTTTNPRADPLGFKKKTTREGNLQSTYVGPPSPMLAAVHISWAAVSFAGRRPRKLGRRLSFRPLPVAL